MLLNVKESGYERNIQEKETRVEKIPIRHKENQFVATKVTWHKKPDVHCEYVIYLWINSENPVI